MYNQSFKFFEKKTSLTLQKKLKIQYLLIIFPFYYFYKPSPSGLGRFIFAFVKAFFLLDDNVMKKCILYELFYVSYEYYTCICKYCKISIM